jgi:tetratricopeptide (TPR) repeat protein
MINMARALLDRGRELWQENRYDEATRVLSRLLSLRFLPSQVAERAQFYLGDIHLAMGHYTKARRHLAAALVSGPDTGETHFLMACAIDWDEEPDVSRAYRHYHRAVQLEPAQPLYSSVYALQRIRRKKDVGKVDREALRRLREAFAAQPDDADIVHNYASGLMDMGLYGEAELAIRRARRRWTGHPAFEELWHEYLSRRGDLTRRLPSAWAAPKLCVVGDDEPIFLPFPGAAARTRVANDLGPRSRLKTALETLSAQEIESLGQALGLPRQRHVAQQRCAVREALLDRAKLRSLVEHLSPDSRHVIRLLADAGGSVAIKRLRMRIDRPSAPRGPHGRRRAIPLDELRQAGLVFRAGRATGPDDAECATIPSDLRKLLREVMASAN